jgi:hypothetical protein
LKSADWKNADVHRLMPAKRVIVQVSTVVMAGVRGGGLVSSVAVFPGRERLAFLRNPHFAKRFLYIWGLPPSLSESKKPG